MDSVKRGLGPLPNHCFRRLLTLQYLPLVESRVLRLAAEENTRMPRLMLGTWPSVQIKPPQRKLLLFQSLLHTLQPSELILVVKGYTEIVFYSEFPWSINASVFFLLGRAFLAWWRGDSRREKSGDVNEPRQ
jgi:hypothetical protein